jgi:hypothetical protein
LNRRLDVARPLAIAVCLWAAPRAAHAWTTTEHQEIGAASYLAACTEVEALVTTPGRADEAARARFEIACGANRAIVAVIYGDATAIAGDFVGHPEELLSPAGAWRFSSPKHYYLLALENSAHFNPMSTESWREYHQDALREALAAARAEGLPRFDHWEQALRENAFADHMLQDSFAAGHMGFNRRASSAAAAKAFHDHWNARGRVVTDRGGDTWTTYGDGKLDDPANAAGRRHVITAATLSVRDLVLTFVFDRPHPEASIEALRTLPFTIEAPELLVDAQALVERRTTVRQTAETPLVTTVVPARKNTVVGARVWSASPFAHDADPTVAATASVELAVPVLPAQTIIGAGATLRRPSGGSAAVVEAGLLAHLGLSLDGLVSHEVSVAASFIFLRTVEPMIHAEYEANIELGTSMLTLQGGLAGFWPAREIGWYAGFGYAFVFSAAGGGSL